MPFFCFVFPLISARSLAAGSQNKEGGHRGKGESGMGVYKGKFSFESFTHRKVVAIQSPNFDPLAKYPPYDVSKEM